MQNETDRPASSPTADPLDRLLRSAAWPDEDTDPLDRLLRMAEWPGPPPSPRWHGSKKRKWGWVAGGLAAAAGLFLALAIWSVLGSGRRSSADVATTIGLHAMPRHAVSGDVTPGRGSRPIRAHSAWSKTDGVRETVVAINSPDLERALPPGGLYRRMLLARSGAQSPSDNTDWIAQLLVERITHPSADLAELIQSLVPDRTECERCLLERFHSLGAQQQSAAIEVLGCIGSEASVPLLLQLTGRPRSHVQAVRSLLKIADTATLARLALKECDPDLREEITAALRTRGDRHTLALVLAAQGERLCSRTGSDL